jgi:hypothetical protein
LERIEYVGVELPSFQKGSQALEQLVEVKVSAKAIEKLTEKFGKERLAVRCEQVERFEQGKLKALHREAPAAVAVSADGGRAQIRQAEAGPGVHEPQWIETKVAHLATFTKVEHSVDPRPEPPSCYLDKERVPRLVDELKGARAKAPSPQEKCRTPRQRQEKLRGKKPSWRPRPLVRSVVATTRDVGRFGVLVATAAMLRGFFAAAKKAFVGDGSPWIWGLCQTQFPGFREILDFLHLLSKLYGAACAAYVGEREKSWKLYTELIRLAWAGQVTRVLEILRKHSQRLGRSPKDAREEDPRKILELAVGYVEANRTRMDYPRYRREGLPIHSAYIESLIKQVNRRVKGTEKFWLRDQLEAVLECRAAYLSQDGSAAAFWRKRPPPSRAVGCNRFKPAA